MYRCTVALSTTDSIREEEEQKANRTDALFSLLPDAFHMTEKERARQRERERERDGEIGRERAAQPMLCSHELIQLSLLDKFNQL